MGPISNDNLPFAWSAPQRRALLALLALFLVVLLARIFMDRTYIPDPQPGVGARANELASRIDPNTADWQTLSALPTLGEKRAKEIIAYRDHIRDRDGTDLVFKEPRDLLRVRGIGLSMVENLRPYLMFPAQDRPATAPNL